MNSWAFSHFMSKGLLYSFSHQITGNIGEPEAEVSIVSPG